MPISYKHKIYTTLGTPTALSGNVVSATDNAGVPAKDYTVKGKTIVWNQLLDKSKYPVTTTTNGVTFTNNGDGSIAVNGTATDVSGFLLFSSYADSLIPGHKYLISGSPNNASINAYIQCYDSINRQWLRDTGGGSIAIFPKVIGPNTGSFIRIRIAGGYTANNLVFKPQLFDLTKMFGAGNEPTTPAEFRAMFPDDYYPYNAGELKSIVPTSIEASGIERFQLLDKSKYPATTTTNGVTFTNNGDGTITVNGTGGLNDVYYNLVPPAAKSGHKYMLYGCPTGGSSNTYDIVNTIYRSGRYSGSFSDMGNGAISRALEEGETFTSNIFIAEGYTANNLIFKPQLFDLTQMFGAGNEPATPAEFWQRVPEKLYGYNPSAYKSVNIPSSKYFPDGMRSAGSVYDEINFLSQKAIKRIGSVDLGTLNWTRKESQTSGIFFFETSLNSIPQMKIAENTVFWNWILISNSYTRSTSSFIFYGTVENKSYGGWDGRGIRVRDDSFTEASAFKAAMSGVMLYYELATPVETAIAPPLQALSTYKGFTSFSAPNSLTQNGPLSVTYYAEGGTSPEKGWLTSYKRKLYMGRNIEWNQLMDVSNFITKRIAGNIVASKKANGTIHIFGSASNGGGRTGWGIMVSLTANHKYYAYQSYANLVGPFLSLSGQTSKYFIGEFITCDTSGTYFFGYNTQANTQYDTDVRVMLFDLTQMFGAGNEPSTPEEFWSYFDHKLYPYNAGETQPLFKISRKSQWGSATPASLYVGEDIIIPQIVRN